MNCDDAYEAVISGTGRGNYALFDLAQCFLAGYDPEKLRAMLRSDDDGIVSDGLFVVSEIGALAKDYMNEILVLEHSEDVEVKRKAAALLAIYNVGE